MVLGSCARLLVRRLALRKGVSLVIVCVTLLGALLLYHQYSKPSNNVNGDIRRIVVPSRHSPVEEVAKKENEALQQQPSPRHQDGPIKSQQPHVIVKESNEPDEIIVFPENLPECIFSSAQPTGDHVDVTMSELVDQLAFDDPTNPNGWNQGFDITYKMEDFIEHPLQVFVVPHSHNDPGWIKTFEEYYRAQTRNILNLMTDSLAGDKRKKFIWAEISYLDLWWTEQSPAKREQFKKLVEGGQIEIVTGGWVMNDEANTHYFAMLDQLIEGHQWMAKNLPGIKPSTGWAIDPFGYTATMPYLLQGTGLESMLIQRVHYAVKKQLALNRQLEFGWLQQWDGGYDSGILCHMMPFYSYDVPHTCGPHPKVCCQFDFIRLPGGRIKCPWKVSPVAITDDNVKERAEMLLNQYRLKSKLYRSNIVLAPLGDDFRWDSQREIDHQFTNYYKLMDYINSHPELHASVQFGTLSNYFDALRATSPPDRRNSLVPDGLPMLTGDFFTYADRADHYWSGYYTSRPYHKNMDRVLQAYLRAAEVMYSLVMSHDLPVDGKLRGVASHLTSARRNLGLFQHHDGITGTAKDHVVVDYAKKMLSSITACQGIISAALKALTTNTAPSPDVVMEMTFEPNEKFELKQVPQESIISVTEGPKIVSFVNPLPQVAKQLVTVTVNSPKVMVSNSSDASVACQLSPVWSNGVIAMDTYRLSFPVVVPPLGFSHYQLSQQGGVACVPANVQYINMGPIQSDVFKTEEVVSAADFVLSSHSISAKFSGTNGLLKSITTGSSEVRTEVEFVVYGTTSGKDKSGAYLFMPGGKASGVSAGKSPVSVVIGPLLQEVRTIVQSGLVVHSVQLFNSPGMDGRSVAISNLVDITRESNKEVAMRVHTSIANTQDTFYTDDNGYQLVKRRTYSKLTLQGNFYPMPTSALVQDANHRVTLFTGQPLGVASLKQGWLEVILDRRLMQDDNRGLGQGVKDSVPTREPFRLLVERRMGEASPTAQLVYHSLMGHATLDSLLHPLHIHTSPHISHTLTSYTPLPRPFPCDFNLVNLRTLLTEGGGETAESALILHRRGFDCGFDVGPLQCSLVDGEVKLLELFKTPPTAVSHTSLSLLHERAVLDSDTGFLAHVNPMDIHTYRLTW
ncbi:alpha-mannosidase 2x-like [Halichondria panicea]|uniref:alpha-mannosidase 2x-like n=1 Tax=Halichondria panicea TaxID=6063 RepID=UPI00312B5075